MIKKYFLIVLLTLLSIGIFHANTYFKIKNSEIKKEIEKYTDLINELKKIKLINKKIYSLNIPVYSHTQTKKIVIDKIDSMHKILPIELKNFSDINHTIKAEIFLNTNIKNPIQQKEIISLFNKTLPFIFLNYFDVLKYNVKSYITVTMPYKVNNEK